MSVRSDCHVQPPAASWNDPTISTSATGRTIGEQFTRPTWEDHAYPGQRERAHAQRVGQTRIRLTWAMLVNAFSVTKTD